MPGDRKTPRAVVRPAGPSGSPGCWCCSRASTQRAGYEAPGFVTALPTGGLAILWFLLRGVRVRQRRDRWRSRLVVTSPRTCSWAPRRRSPSRWRPRSWCRPWPRCCCCAAGARSSGAAAASGRWTGPGSSPGTAPRWCSPTALGRDPRDGRLDRAHRSDPLDLGGLLWFGRNLCSALHRGHLRPAARGAAHVRAAAAAAAERRRPAGAGRGLAVHGRHVRRWRSGSTSCRWRSRCSRRRCGSASGSRRCSAQGTRSSPVSRRSSSRWPGSARSPRSSGPTSATCSPSSTSPRSSSPASALSTGRDERQALAEELRRARDEAEYQASVREAVIGSMNEGLFVLDDRGEVLLHNAQPRSDVRRRRRRASSVTRSTARSEPVGGRTADGRRRPPLAPGAGGRDRARRRGPPQRSPDQPDRVVAVSAVPLAARRAARPGPRAGDLPRHHDRARPARGAGGVRRRGRPRPAQPAGRHRRLDRDDRGRARLRRPGRRRWPASSSPGCARPRAGCGS